MMCFQAQVQPDPVPLDAVQQQQWAHTQFQHPSQLQLCESSHTHAHAGDVGGNGTGHLSRRQHAKLNQHLHSTHHNTSSGSDDTVITRCEPPIQFK